MWCAVSAVAFAVSLFTKHDLVSFPLSVGVHLLVTRNWRGFVVFLGAGFVASGALLALSLHLDGPWFFADLLQPRAYSGQNLRAETLHYLLHFFVPLSVGIAVLGRGGAVPGRGFLLILLVFSNLLAVCFSGGDGVAANIFYPALIADLLACVIAICRLQGRGFRVTLVITTLAGALMVPFQLHDDIVARRHLPAATAAAQQAIALLAATPGPAICEDLLLCYEAGKPMDFDPYYVRDQILIGRLPESGVLALLAARHYAVIQMDARQEGRFTPAFLRVLASGYRAVRIGGNYSIFVPRS